MVYNKNSIRYYWYGLYQGIFKLKFLKYNSLYDINMSYTDGYIAKHYTRKDIFKLFKSFVISAAPGKNTKIPPGYQLTYTRTFIGLLGLS